MQAHDIIHKLLPADAFAKPKEHATCFAPSNIALIKYWGKRDTQLNLPNTSSLSVTLPQHGTRTHLCLSHDGENHLIFNGKLLENTHPFKQRVINYLKLLCQDQKLYFKITTDNNIPTAAGLASSASGFAALVMALDQLFGWQLSTDKLSILARLGSGSACRSFWPGFVEWYRGERKDGLDSFASAIFSDQPWPELRLGLLIITTEKKPIGSTQAMQQTVQTSALYQQWPARVEQDMKAIKQAILTQDFHTFGHVAEQNAIAMHETMLTSEPSINYSLPETITAKQKVWDLRQHNIPVYFTQDAGPNLKLIYLAQDETKIKTTFAQLESIVLFS